MRGEIPAHDLRTGSDPMNRRLAYLALLLSACTGDAPPAETTTIEEPQVQAAAPPPDADIWLATLVRDSQGTLAGIGEVIHAVARPGYDNQPFFRPDGRGFWYTEIDDLGQADIHWYDLELGETSAVTTTAPESEYSATPLGAGEGFSAIRVEADSTQRLWRFDADGSNAAVLFEHIAPVGYHAWADSRTVVMFVLGDPATLRVADTSIGEAQVVARDIGRSVQQIPGTAHVSFVQRLPDGGTEIRRLMRGSGVSDLIATGIEGGEFHAWTPDGVLLQAHGSRLYAWIDGDTQEWVEIGDLAGVADNLSRLAVSPDGSLVAVVGEAAGDS
jgi:hypothetical protein